VISTIVSVAIAVSGRHSDRADTGVCPYGGRGDDGDIGANNLLAVFYRQDVSPLFYGDIVARLYLRRQGIGNGGR
jgi:hypothetical protein